ncbi:WG repeat-containing protein [Persicobacter sp. CCB-QB2]|uniref:WG repeat-containing protein n=1 Tax=Persicobacter sp. CCB-QB2 TaxID=1561025 RepID=UPI0006A95DEA|nr:WG repeat-containing protein [Persicobacter sp. CCB-QB2]
MNKRMAAVAALMIFWQGVMADNVKKVYKAIEKKEYAKAEAWLKDDMQLDSLAPAVNLAYSELYLQLEYEKYNIDSAHQRILAAQQGYHNIDDERVLDRLEKASVNQAVLDQQERRIDSLAFDLTQKMAALDRYNYFIAQYPEAPQHAQAISERNQIAFDQAVDKGTFLSYFQFMQRYPKADQYEAAQEKYDALLFEAKTKNGKLKSFMSFLEEYPDSPFRGQAEIQIFDFIASDNSEKPLLWFLQEYSQTSAAAPIAMGYLYYWYKEQGNLDNFFERFANVSKIDSLQHFSNISEGSWVPFYEDGEFFFIDQNGEEAMPNRFDQVARDYKCDPVAEDVLLVIEDQQPKLLARDGHLVFQGKINEAYDLGYGVMEIINEGLHGLVHKTGKVLAAPQYEEIRRLSPSFFAVRKKKYWGVVSATGRLALKPEYDEIEQEGDFYIFRKGKKYGITNKQQLVKGADNSSVPLFFNYDDYEVVGQDHVIAMVGNQESLFNNKMEEIIPLGNHVINSAGPNWVSRTSDYLMFDPLGKMKYEIAFDAIAYNDKWWAAEKDGWSFQGWEADHLPQFDYDSVAFLGKEFAYVKSEDSTTVYFSSGNYKNLDKDYKCRIVKSGFGKDAVEYLALIEGKNWKVLLDGKGEEVIKGSFKEIVPLDTSMFVVEANGKKGLMSRGSKQELKMLYQGIADFHDGYVSLLLNGKFGIYNPYNALYIRPQFTTKLNPINDQMLIADKAGKLGMVDEKGKTLVNFQYDRIENWNDSLVLARKEKQWEILAVENKEVVFDEIERYLPVNPQEKGGDLIVVVNGKEGLFSLEKGVKIKPTLDRLINVGTPAKPLYKGEKYIAEADLYLWVYYDEEGNRLRQQTFNAEEFENVDCMEL